MVDPSCIYEKDAKQLMCPLLGINSSGTLHRQCKASLCMAWRWYTPEFEVYGEQKTSGFGNQIFFPPGEFPPKMVDTMEWEWVHSHGKGEMELGQWRRPFGDRRYGYCGHFEPKVAEVETSS